MNKLAPGRDFQLVPETEIPAYFNGLDCFNAQLYVERSLLRHI